MNKKILVPLAQGCEELEAVTIIDLLRRAGLKVVTASLEGEPNQNPITASRGVRLLADASLDDLTSETFDMIVLPGGLPGADHLQKDQRIIDLLQQISNIGGYTAAICAAPKVLATAGLLDGKEATSYPGVLETLNLDSTILSSKAIVTDGKVVTSRGPGTAMDFALELIEVLAGEEIRQEVEEALQR